MTNKRGALCYGRLRCLLSEMNLRLFARFGVSLLAMVLTFFAEGTCGSAAVIHFDCPLHVGFQQCTSCVFTDLDYAFTLDTGRKLTSDSLGGAAHIVSENSSQYSWQAGTRASSQDGLGDHFVIVLNRATLQMSADNDVIGFNGVGTGVAHYTGACTRVTNKI